MTKKPSAKPAPASAPDFGDWIEVSGAHVHNLKNVDVRLPRHRLSVVTGLSGSGKSSLAFDTLYAEGQRRYIETFSAYARNFLDNLERPDVDSISGLSPVISIEQKTTNKNPRSTVGTVTEVYDFLRLLYARAGTAYSYLSGEPMVRFTEERIINLFLSDYEGHKVMLLAPLVRGRKGHYHELFENIRRKGYLTVRVDGEIREIVRDMRLDRYKTHDVEVVIDKLKIQSKDRERLQKSLKAALQQGNGLMMALDMDDGSVKYYSKRLMDPVSGLSYQEPAPNNFSFNSAQGACPKCNGLGYVNIIDKEKVIPDTKQSIYNGGLAPLGKYRNTLIFWEIETILAQHDCTLKTPICDLPEQALDDIFNGVADRLRIPSALSHTTDDLYVQFDGLAKYIRQMADTEMTAASQRWAEQFSKEAVCPQCEGARLNREALSYRIDGKNIAELSDMDIRELYEWLKDVETRIEKRQATIAHEVLKEIRARLRFMLDVGLDYLALGRSAQSLSGGESQRIRLATQIGSQLINVLYILDEPSIGLHQRDNVQLIRSLQELRDMGNSVIVVEHDKDMMLAADYIVDMGPLAGRLGGQVIFQGTPSELLKQHTLTADYLTGRKCIPVPSTRRKGSGEKIKLRGACGNNLKNINVDFPLGTFICVTGVSGSGKSTLINETLQPIFSQHLYRSLKSPMPYKKCEGLDLVDKIVAVDQSPIGRTPRSNPATYTGVFSDIRNLYVDLPEAKIRGYKAGRFSFNVKGGRCENCKGNGYKTIEMNFMPDVLVPCEECHGRRYNRETLEVRFKGKSIAEVLDLTINNAVEFFENVPHILHKIKVLQDVGLGYIKLGQSSTTLSGGESQRVKLATELSKRDTGKTLYILDEPTTGLHFEDIRILLNVLNQLVDRGNTVIVIEHNMDVIKSADYIIDMGPEGGHGGGEIVSLGTPEQIVKKGKGHTAPFLARELKPTKQKVTNNNS